MVYFIQSLFLLLVVSLYTVNPTKAEETETEVLVLGAGMAGIVAAKTLQEKGVKDFIILEGLGRMGGRTREETFRGHKVQVGAQWLDGTSQRNPVIRMLEELNVTMGEPSKNDFHTEWTVRSDTQRNITGAIEDIYNRYDVVSPLYDTYASTLRSDDRPDISIRNALRYVEWEPKTDNEHFFDWIQTDFILGSTPEEHSAKHLYTQPSTTLITDYNGAFDRLYSNLYEGFVPANESLKRLKLNAIVESIAYSDDDVKVQTKNGDVYRSKRVIVTFSVGVLQSNAVEFKPHLPDWKRESIYAFQMAHYVTIMIYIQTRFWDSVNWIAHASSSDGHQFPMFLNWDKVKPGTHILQAHITGTEALRVQGLNDQQIREELIVTFRNMYGRRISLSEISVKLHRWSEDEVFKGSFTAWPYGFSTESHEALCAPVAERLFFAGEACKREYIGSVHGAYWSGVETADTVAKCIQEKECPLSYVPPYAAKGCMYMNAMNYDNTSQIDDGSCEIEICCKASGMAGSIMPTICVAMVSILFHKY